MQNNKYIKLYAAFKAGYMGQNILNTYFPFFANILYENHIEVIDEYLLQTEFNNKYNFEPTIPFIRQVLSVGLENKSIKKVANNYISDFSELKKYSLNTDDFESNWSKLIYEFENYCSDNKTEYDTTNAEDDLISYIENNDYLIISQTDLENTMPLPNSFEYAWVRFIKRLAENSSPLLDFIAAISASNIFKDALLYSGEVNDSFKGLNVYLDSPMVFALLGMDSLERTKSYQILLKDMIKAGCNVQILDNNYIEIEGIINRSATWAHSTQYTISKATKVAKYLHDLDLSPEEMVEYCESIEEKLNNLGITIRKTDFNMQDASFQEDETELFNMVKARYDEQHMGISEEKAQSIETDVRSIILVYRERKGRTSVKIQTCSDIMLTLNGVLANVSKQYESNRSVNAGHIPACISADLFGALLWLNSPNDIVNYHKHKLLADCYSSLQPSKKLLDKYISSLENAKSLGEIDEKKYLFMRSHSMVSDALMNVTKGDYARFNDRTYLDVYEEIKSQARKEYLIEAEKHNQTKKDLQNIIFENNLLSQKNAELSGEFISLKQDFENYKKEQIQKEEKRFNSLSTFIGNCIAFILLIFPYVLILVKLEFVKAKYAAQVTKGNIIYLTLAVIISLIVAFLYMQLKKIIVMLVRKIMSKYK